MSKATSSAKSIFGLEVSGSLTNAINQLQIVGDANFVKAQAKIFKKGYMKQLVDHYLAIDPDQDKSFRDFFEEIPNSTLNKYRSESKEAKEIQMKKDKEIMDRREENLREMRAEQEAEAEMAQKRAEQAPAMDKGKTQLTGLEASGSDVKGKKAATPLVRAANRTIQIEDEPTVKRTKVQAKFTRAPNRTVEVEEELPNEIGQIPDVLVNPVLTPAENDVAENNTQQAAVNAMPGMGHGAAEQVQQQNNPAVVPAAAAPEMQQPQMVGQAGVLRTIGQPNRGLMLSDLVGTFINPRPGSFTVASSGQLTPNLSTFDMLSNNVATIKDIDLLTPAGRQYLQQQQDQQQLFQSALQQQQVAQLPENYRQLDQANRQDIISRSVVPNPYTQAESRYLNYLRSMKK